MQKDGINIGIQTEQIFDENGKEMWRKLRKFRMLRDLFMYDRILDMSEHNRPAYQWLPKVLYSKIDFGPYIFPKKKIEYSLGEKQQTVFFGYVNDRRGQELDKIPQDLFSIIKGEKFGDELSVEIQKCSGVLNVHFLNAVYTEWPRVLCAYIHGKPIVSEKLSASLIEGVHYVNPTEIADFQKYGQVFENFRDDIALNYTIDDYLFTIPSVKTKGN